MTVAATVLFGIVSAGNAINTEDLQTTLPIMPNLPEERESREDLEGEKARGRGWGWGCSVAAHHVK